MNIALGTANFGSKYGINKKNINSIKNIKKILKYCSANKINILDNAQSYGSSEKLLSQCKLKKFKVITKIKLPKKYNKKDINKNIIKSLFETILKLKINKFYAILIHKFSKKKQDNLRLISILKEIKKKKLVKKIGISVYSPEELERIWIYWKPDIVQCPLNVLDQRFYRSGCLNKLNKLKIEVHIRSIFLQGLLLKNYNKIPKKFVKWNYLFKRWIKFCNINKVSQLEGCIQFINSLKFSSKVIIGFANLNQIKQIIMIAKKSNKMKLFKYYSNNKRLIEPRLW